MKRKKLEIAGNQAVKILRRTKLAMGFPFMINSYLLPSNQCYMEYPDGSIKLVTIDKDNSDFKILSDLSPDEVSSIRKKYKLI